MLIDHVGENTLNIYKHECSTGKYTEITSSMRLWKINHSGPGCSFYEFTSGVFSSKTPVSIY